MGGGGGGEVKVIIGVYRFEGWFDNSYEITYSIDIRKNLLEEVMLSYCLRDHTISSLPTSLTTFYRNVRSWFFRSYTYSQTYCIHKPVHYVDRQHAQTRWALWTGEVSYS